MFLKEGFLLISKTVISWNIILIFNNSFCINIFKKKNIYIYFTYIYSIDYQ